MTMRLDDSQQKLDEFGERLVVVAERGPVNLRRSRIVPQRAISAGRSVRVPAKMRLDLPLQGLDLLVEGDQDRNGRASGGRVRSGDHRVSAQLLAAQRGLEWVIMVSMSRRRACLSAARIWLRFSFAAEAGSRRLAQQLEGVGSVQVVERLQRRGEVLTQRVAQPQYG